MAATDLRPGTLLSAADLATSMPPAAGQVLVPVALKPSQLPASGLAAGDHVIVVWAPGSSSGSAAAAGVPGSAIAGVVEAVTGGPDSDGLDVVDLLVPAGAGPNLARESAAGDIALVVTGRTP